MKKQIAFFAATVMALNLLPIFKPQITTQAAEENKNVTLGTSGLNDNDFLYFGKYENKPIKWQILSKNGNGGTYYEHDAYSPLKAPENPESGNVYTDSDGTKFIYLSNGSYYKEAQSGGMFLQSEYNLCENGGYANFDEAGANKWKNSYVKIWCNGSFVKSAFSDREKKNLLRTKKSSVQMDALEGEEIFCLSKQEYEAYSHSMDIKRLNDDSSDKIAHWLRTASYSSDYTVYRAVKERNTASAASDYSYYCDEHDVNASDTDIRPAFNLNKEDVLFVTAAKGGKDLSKLGELTKNASSDTKEYKPTLKDDTKLIRLVDASKQTVDMLKSETVVTFDYISSTENTGDNEYTSVMIVNSANEVVYYGQLEERPDTLFGGSKVYLSLPAGLELGNYTVNVFIEEINGDYEPDYASEFASFELEVQGKRSSLKTTDGKELEYGRLEGAFEAAQTNPYSTVVLHADTRADVTAEGGEFGYTSNYKLNGLITVNEDATLTIKSGDFTTPYPKLSASVQNNGTIYINEGNFDSAVVNEGQMYIKGGTIYFVSAKAGGKTEISGGEITQLTAVSYEENVMPQVEVRGGKFKRVESYSNPSSLPKQPIANLVKDGYCFVYKESAVDGSLYAVGNSSDDAWVTVEPLLTSYDWEDDCPTVYTGDETTFKIENIVPAAGFNAENITFEWRHNGNKLSSTSNSWTGTLDAGTHKIECAIKLNGYVTTLTFKRTIKKASVSVPKIPTLEAEYGDKVGTLELPEATDGAFEWMNPNDYVGDAGERTHKVRFVPTDPLNYATVENIDVKIKVKAQKNIVLGTEMLQGEQKTSIYFGTYPQTSLGNTRPESGTENTDWIKSSSATNNNQGAYYEKNPIKWRVLSVSGSKVMLLADKNLDVVRYHNSDSAVTWSSCSIRSWLNNESDKDSFIKTAFSDKETDEIKTTAIAKESANGYDTNDKMFLLSVSEANNTSYGFTETENPNINPTREAANTDYVYGGGRNGSGDLLPSGVTDAWLLRTPGGYNNYVSVVGMKGGVDTYGAQVNINSYAVRPAMNLSTDSVAFMSRPDGKTVNVGVLAENGENASGEYKLTLQDSEREFELEESALVGYKGEEVKFRYKGAKFGDNEYISAMILDDNSVVTYYGQVANSVGESGEAKLKVPENLANGSYTMYVFNEQINGDGKTDYASRFVSVELEVTTLKKVTVTFDGEETTVKEKYTFGENGALPENVTGYRVVRGENEFFVPAGEFVLCDGDDITTAYVNVEMANGAQVRYGSGVDENGEINSGNGIRFTATVDRSSTGDEIVEYGMTVSAEKSDVTVDVKAEKWQDGDAMTIFTVAITDLNVSNYNRNFTAKAYAKVRYYNGETAKIYGSKSVTRSIYAVSSGLLKNQATDDERLYSVLNAYVNMVGVRLKMDKSGNVSPMKTGEGAYSGDVFFSVTSTDNGDGVYTVTVTPLKSFKNKVTIMGYWKEFVRINNNNSVVKDCISNVTENEDGGITFTFTPPKN